MPKDLCIELVGKAMGAIPWLDETLNMQSTQTRDTYVWNRGVMPYARGWNNHGRDVMARCYGSMARQGGLRQRTRLVVHGMGKVIVGLD